MSKGFRTYQALKGFSCGQLRCEIERAQTLEWNGTLARYQGQTTPFKGFEDLVLAGFLRRVDPQDDQPPPEEDPPQNLLVESGTPPRDKAHEWEYDLFSSGEKTCKVCGVSMQGEMNNFIDKKSMKYVYRDAYGVTISSLTELPCPLFVGDLGGGVANNTYRGRKLEGRVQDLDGDLQEMRERMKRLEDENALLARQAARRQELALDLMARLATAAERLAELGDPHSGSRLLSDQGEILDAVDLWTTDSEGLREKTRLKTDLRRDS